MRGYIWSVLTGFWVYAKDLFIFSYEDKTISLSFFFWLRHSHMVEGMHDCIHALQTLPFLTALPAIDPQSPSLPRYDSFTSIFCLSSMCRFTFNSVFGSHFELHCCIHRARRSSILCDCPVDGRCAGSRCITNWDARAADNWLTRRAKCHPSLSSQTFSPICSLFHLHNSMFLLLHPQCQPSLF